MVEQWHMTSAIHWPGELVQGEFPPRGQHAVDEEEEFQRLLSEGWEPFDTHQLGEATRVWLKRFGAAS